MALSKLKSALIGLELEESEHIDNQFDTEQIEVIADSIQQALRIASKELNIPLENLDYEVIRKDRPGFLGIGKFPCHILAFRFKDILDERFEDIERELLEDKNLLSNNSLSVSNNSQITDVNGWVKVRIYKLGVYITVFPPQGNGIPIDVKSAFKKIKSLGVTSFKQTVVEKAVKLKEAKEIQISPYTSSSVSNITVAISNNNMEASVYLSPYVRGSRHLELSDIKRALKDNGVVFGYEDAKIEQALDNDTYGISFVAATGRTPIDGANAYINYKVRVAKNIDLQEDSSGKVNFLNQNLIENVVKEQTLAELVPAQAGIPGQNIKGIKLHAKDGKPISLKVGKGTALVDNGTRLISQKNGQVVFFAGIINVEDVYYVSTDVGIYTGNISFLGSLLISGSIEDNMEVKASGNIEVAGTIQKANIEAEGDIIVRSGIQGRKDAVIESTGGAIFAKFVQNSELRAVKDIVVSEVIMHSKVQTSGKIICTAKRGQIVGGEILAGDEIRVKQLGSQAGTPTMVVVGVPPLIVKQQRHWEQVIADTSEQLEKLAPNLRSLLAQQQTLADKFSQEKLDMLKSIQTTEKDSKIILDEAKEELQKLEDELLQLSNRGSVHIEDTLYPGVTIEINHATFTAKDEYHKVTLIEEKGVIKMVAYRPLKKEPQKTTSRFPKKGR